ncbi:MAG: NTP transferase domain-containing protein, partial [Thaumarchaeota archaeon]|nr:NTP transferase domain-containing protein [Nitrososphaerota archaeon]
MNMRVRKAVIPAAGFGTRFLPLTKSQPKEMLPIVNKPIIHYVVMEAIQSGIEDIIIVTGRGKRSIEDYFDFSPELETHLKKVKKENLLKEINSLLNKVTIHYVRQYNPLGLGDAILKTEKHVGSEPFAVLLGDDVFFSPVPCTKQLLSTFDRTNESVIAVEKSEDYLPYGIASLKKVGNLHEVTNLMEKPKKKTSKWKYIISGRYILTSDIFDNIKNTSKDLKGEIQLTNAL